MPEGIIKRLLRDKGFGFIKMDGKVEEMFFHRSACREIDFDTLKEGQAVLFEIGSGQKGPRAEDVRLKG